MRHITTLAFVLFLSCVFVVRCLWFDRANAQAFDESVYIASGLYYIEKQDFRINPEHPPLAKILSALPLYLQSDVRTRSDLGVSEKINQYAVGFDLLHHSSIDPDRILSLARLPSICLGAFLVALIGRWCYRLWGAYAAILGAGLAAFDPNLIAHSSVVGNDLPLTVFFFLTFYILWENRSRGSIALTSAAGLTAGLALATKYSSLILVPIIALIMVSHFLIGDLLPNRFTEPVDGRGGRTGRLMSVLLAGYLLVAAASTVVALSYLGSDVMRWFDGILWQLGHRSAGHEAYLFGDVSRHGWLSYFLFCFFYKTPLGSIILIFLGLVPNRRGPRFDIRDGIFLIFPALSLFVAISVLRVDLGLRYILPIYPFLLVVASRSAKLSFNPMYIRYTLVLTPLALTAVSSLKIAPHDLAYFNEFAGGPSHGMNLLGGSNLDWGQDLRGLREFMRRENLPMIYLSYYGTDSPASHGIHKQDLPTPWSQLARISLLPEHPGRDILAISVNNLQGCHLKNPRTYRWLLRKKPIARIGYTIYIYDLTGDADSHINLAKVYRNVGSLEAADRELQKALSCDPANPEALMMLNQTPKIGPSNLSGLPL